MASDLFGSQRVQQMKANILLAYAMNRVSHMAPAELMSCVRLPPGWPTLVWRDAVYQLRDEGIIQIGAYKAGDCSIPALMLTDAAVLPYNEAQRFMRRQAPNPGPYPRTKIPAERAVRFDDGEETAHRGDPDDHRPQGPAAAPGPLPGGGCGHDR